VSFGTVVYKNRLEAGFDSRDDAFIDIALGYFAGRTFNIKFFQLVRFYFGDPAFFRVNGVYKNLYTLDGLNI
jgi:hypothetical protein